MKNDFPPALTMLFNYAAPWEVKRGDIILALIQDYDSAWNFARRLNGVYITKRKLN